MATNTLPFVSGRFAGLTDGQVLMLLGKIATTAHLMAGICRDKAEDLGEHDAALTFHALDTMLASVGAMADMPSGGHCVGSFADWMVGPLFKNTTELESET